jgi:hyperosmotically inducible protein
MKRLRLVTVIGLVFALASVSACQTLTGRGAGRYVDDKTITAAVKSKLVAEKATNLTRIGVSTVNGVVMLTGTADSVDDKARAEAIAQKVDGVKHVQNHIQVRGTPAASLR